MSGAMKPKPITKFLYSAMTLKSGYNRLSVTEKKIIFYRFEKYDDHNKPNKTYNRCQARKIVLLMHLLVLCVLLEHNCNQLFQHS